MNAQDLKKTLEELMKAIEARKDCLPYLSKIEKLTKTLDLDSRLAHFLERRSYEKALMFLKHEETARGSCEK